MARDNKTWQSFCMKSIVFRKKFQNKIAKPYSVLTRKSYTILKLPAQYHTLALFGPNNKCISKITQYINDSFGLLKNCALSHSKSITYIRQRHMLSQIIQCHQDSFLNCYQKCITSLALDRIVRSNCVDKSPICALHHPVKKDKFR